MKKNMLSLLLVAAFAMILTGSLVSCKSATEKAGEEAMESALEAASGEKTDIDISNGEVTIETEGKTVKIKDQKGGKWFAEISGDVPEFDYGTIGQTRTSTAPEGDTWTMVFSGVNIQDMEKNEGILKKKGLKTMKVMMGDNGSVTAEKVKLNVNVSKSDETCIVTVF
ncbi:MAG: hypothetical protein FJY10_05565 [Bacteroidetes bacterium]|nr:hypothetical protein [Bacteroidota bacterium]